MRMRNTHGLNGRPMVDITMTGMEWANAASRLFQAYRIEQYLFSQIYDAHNESISDASGIGHTMSRLADIHGALSALFEALGQHRASYRVLPSTTDDDLTREIAENRHVIITARFTPEDALRIGWSGFTPLQTMGDWEQFAGEDLINAACAWVSKALMHSLNDIEDDLTDDAELA